MTAVTWGTNTLGSLSGGNLLFTYTGDLQLGGAIATVGFSSGKYYCEMQPTFVSQFDGSIGWADAIEGPGGPVGSKIVGLVFDKQINFNGNTLATLAALSSGDWVGIAIDLSNALVWFIDITASGNWNNNGSANPATGAGGLSLSGLQSLPWYPECAFYSSNSGESVLANFGATSFQGALPSGFSPVGSGGGGGGTLWVTGIHH